MADHNATHDERAKCLLVSVLEAQVNLLVCPSTENNASCDR